MDKETKPKIIIVADEEMDKEAISLLSYQYEISIKTYKELITQIEVNLGNGSSPIRGIVIDFIIVNENSAVAHKNLFSILNRNRIRGLKLIAFGKAAIVLGKMSNAKVLKGISNHKNTNHLTTFCMSDDRLLDFNVRSNHDELIYPHPNDLYDILAFSTHNLSDSYTDEITEVTFKAQKNFLEIEAIKFISINSYCFLYEVPNKSESVLIDLTLQFLNR